MNKKNDIPYLIENNLVNLYKEAALAGNFSTGSTSNYSWVIAEHYPWPNFIFNVSLSEKDTIIIEEIAEKVDRKELPPFWITGPAMDFLNFQEVAYKFYFKQAIQWPGMAIELNKIENAQTSDVIVNVVESPEQLNNWLQIAENNLFNKKQLPRSVFESFMKSQNFRLFLGFYKGQPVATALMFIYGRTAGFYMVSTNKEHRKKGIGRSLMLSALYFAKTIGCTYAVLQANNMSEMLYKAIGFETYARFDIYWKIA